MKLWKVKKEHSERNREEERYKCAWDYKEIGGHIREGGGGMEGTGHKGEGGEKKKKSLLSFGWG